MERWALKWEDPEYPWGTWLEWNLPNPGNLFARERDIQGVFDIFMLHSSTEHLPSSQPCLHLLLGFLWGWLLSRGPSGTPGNGIMRQVSVRHRGCERLLSAWLKSQPRRVLGFLSNHNPYKCHHCRPGGHLQLVDKLIRQRHYLHDNVQTEITHFTIQSSCQLF